jgi:hypothetical protein
VAEEDEQQRAGELRDADPRPVGAEEHQVFHAVADVASGHHTTSGTWQPGKSTSSAAVADRPIGVTDFLATVCAVLGIDHTETSRPP